MKSFFVIIGLTLANILAAQPAGRIEPLSRLYNFWTTAYEIDIENDIAYASTGHSGLQLIDISNPRAPFIAGFYDPPDPIGNCQVQGRFAYLSGVSNFIILNVEDPSNPVEVARLATPGAIQDFVIVGDFAFVTAYDSCLRVISIEEPDNLQVISELPFPSHTRNIVNAGEVAFISDYRSIYKTDISNPEEPRIVNRTALPTRIGNFTVSENVLIASEDDIDDGLLFLEDDEAGQLIIIGSYFPGSANCSLTIQDSLAFIKGFVNDDAFGIGIIDITELRNPHLIGFYQGVSSGGLAVEGELLTAQLGGAQGFGTISIADPRNPRLLGHIHASGSVMDVIVSGEDAYVAKWDDSFSRINIQELEHPREVARCFPDFNAFRIQLSGDYAYVLDINVPTGLHIIGLREFAQVGFLNTGGSAFTNSDLVVSDTLAFVACGTAGLLIVDIRNPAQPSALARIDTPGRAYHIALHNELLYLADYNQLRIIDISEPNDPQEVESYNRFTDWVDTWGDLGFFHSSGSAPVEVYNIEDPVNPNLLSEIPAGEIEDMVIIDTLAFFTSHESRFSALRVFNISNPENPSLIAETKTPGGYSYGLDVVGRTIFQANNSNLGVYRLNLDNQFIIDNIHYSYKSVLISGYPNPFNSTLTISYSIPFPSPVSLKVIDLAGREVATLAEGWREAGAQRMVWNAGALPSGLYSAALQTPYGAYSVRFVLNK